MSLRNDWFTKLTGFSENSPEEVRKSIDLSGSQLTSRVNGKTYQCGTLEILSLDKLRSMAAGVDRPTGKLKISELVGDAKALHADAACAGALFQVASQFNLLEMVSPTVTPEQGIAIYEHDMTHGPACAIACGAGTIYRNYFVELDGQIGQTQALQVDCLAEIGASLGNENSRLWQMQNGYALPTMDGLEEIDFRLNAMSELERDGLRAKLRVGVQWNTEVTLPGCNHLVTQVYCSAMPVAYSRLSSRKWERFARLILEAAYEATLAVAVLNASKSGNPSVYLTLLGGGAFGNDQDWILDAMSRACALYQHHALDVNVVSYRQSNPAIRELCERI